MSTAIVQPHMSKTDMVAEAVGDVFRAHPGEWLTRTQVDNLIPLTDYSRSTLQRAFYVALTDGVIEQRFYPNDRQFRLVEAKQYRTAGAVRVR